MRRTVAARYVRSWRGALWRRALLALPRQLHLFDGVERRQWDAVAVGDREAGERVVRVVAVGGRVEVPDEGVLQPMPLGAHDLVRARQVLSLQFRRDPGAVAVDVAEVAGWPTHLGDPDRLVRPARRHEHVV